MNTADLTVAEYFAGIGLVRLGLEQAGWRVVFANDISPAKYEMYKDAFSYDSKHYIVRDVFQLDPSEVPSTLLATSSFPCIDLSLAGKQNGLSGKHSSAFWGFIRILSEQRQTQRMPPLIMLENVTGWLSSNKGRDFRITLQALNELGYSCDVFTLDALHFTPQSRPRVFVVGIQGVEPSSDLELLLNRSKSLASNRLRQAVYDNLDLNWSWLNIPEPPPLNTTGLASIVELMDDDDVRWWPDTEVKRHIEMMAPTHRKRIEELGARPELSYRTIYRRMRQGRQRAEVRHGDTAGCLRTAVGGSSRQILVRAGWGRIRMRHMTAREYARLQGAPDTYPINVDEIQALTGFGDAVCVPLIAWIGRNVLLPLVQNNSFLNINQRSSIFKEESVSASSMRRL